MDSPLRDMTIITCNHDEFSQGQIGEECLECGLLRPTVGSLSLQNDRWENRQEDIDDERKAQGIMSLQKESEWEEKLLEIWDNRSFTNSGSATLEQIQKLFQEAISNRENEIAEEVEKFMPVDREVNYHSSYSEGKIDMAEKILSFLNH